MLARDTGVRRLARLYGVTTEFTDVLGRRTVAPDETLLTILEALGVGVVRGGQIAEAVRDRERDLAVRALPLCRVAWDGESTVVPLRLPAAAAPPSVPWRLDLEGGAVREGSWLPDGLPLRGVRMLGGEAVATFAALLPGPLPLGHHVLRTSVAGVEHRCALISAPRVGFGADHRSEKQAWGVFLPLYAVRPRLDDGGIADFSDLERLLDAVRPLGARLVGTLPLLAGYLDDPCDPSPYLPVSRLAWNELYLRIDRLPELALAPDARDLLHSRDWRDEASRLQSAPLVDYRAAMAHKRRVLEPIAEAFFERASEARRDAYERFLAERPVIPRYALFRAARERDRRQSKDAPEPGADLGLASDPDLLRARRYHLFVQWAAAEQVAGVDRSAGPDAGLYLDFPVGIHPDGFDAWDNPGLFLPVASVGAPPDAHYTSGQNWGFPPLHPERSRREGHLHLRACIEHHARHASVLRIDHVMSLWRLYWIPGGSSPAHGAYVRYPAEELLALLTLESHRHRTVIVGEDLGTVAPAVRPALERHGVRRMFILQRELDRAEGMPIDRIPAGVLAGMNTHDMPPFAGYWRGTDIADRLAVGLIDEAAARRSRERRAVVLPALASRLGIALTGNADEDAGAVLEACLDVLRRSRAGFTIVSLEDLWLERESQNLPGTSFERPNWRRRARLSLDEIFSQGTARARLEAVSRADH